MDSVYYSKVMFQMSTIALKQRTSLFCRLDFAGDTGLLDLFFKEPLSFLVCVPIIEFVVLFGSFLVFSSSVVL